MFREIRITKPADQGGPKRRWYQSDYFDLYIFYFRHSERADKHADREFTGLQLCYDIRHNQRTLEWKKESGFSHLAVSKGGNDTLSDHGASASLMQQGGQFDADKVIDRFVKESATLPGQVRRFVLQKLVEYANLHPAFVSVPAPSAPVTFATPATPASPAPAVPAHIADPFTLDLPPSDS